MTLVSERLLRAISGQIGPLSGISMQSSDWASATYIGMRHVLWFDALPDTQLEMFLQRLTEIDLTIPGHFLADIELIERSDGAEMVRVGIAALTIEAC